MRSSRRRGKVAKEICSFFIVGNCRFGSKCRNLHPSRKSSPEVVEQRRRMSADASSFGRIPIPCRFFNAGGCSKGIHCKFLHQIVDSSRFEVCRYFLRGDCRFGDRCVLQHDIGEEGKRALVEKECGICLESVAIKASRYGILESCDHVFCLECIKGWRKSQRDDKNDVVRRCPLCRKESMFVVPSSQHVVGKEKKQVIRKYLSALSKKPCKLYTKERYCPYGNACFYMHIDRFGKIVDKSREHSPEIRRKRKDRVSSSIIQPLPSPSILSDITFDEFHLGVQLEGLQIFEDSDEEDYLDEYLTVVNSREARLSFI